METKDLETINTAIQKAYAICSKYNNISVSISGGADSDVMLDMLLKVCPKDKLHFVFFDTGIEYQATKEHLDYLEKQYDITIERVRAYKPVPLGCKEYGQPFISKNVSAKIRSLQHNNFDFKNDGNKSYEVLCEIYPKIKSIIAWWCNCSTSNIDENKYLKEFMILNPPTFKISDQCCNGAKKLSSYKYEKGKNFDLKCLGLRRAEGGIRASKYKSCFNTNNSKLDNFRPIWWFTNKDRDIYDNYYNIKHSKCYTDYGMRRTGCAGCPFSSKFEENLEIIGEYEPKLYKAVNNIFGDSYEYMRAYRKFKAEMKGKEKQGVLSNQISIFDLEENSYDYSSCIGRNINNYNCSINYVLGVNVIKNK